MTGTGYEGRRTSEAGLNVEFVGFHEGRGAGKTDS